MMNANDWIQTLGLEKHPEGGYFREIYRSDESVIKSSLPSRFGGKRTFSTAIYYLLAKQDRSNFHRIKQDEIWHYYEGSPLMIYTIEKKRMTVHRLGNKPSKGQLPMIVIPRGTIFAAEIENKRSFSLVGCTVSPGFEFDDFEMFKREDLLESFPEHEETIRKFT